jgi:hypothetical protein
MINILFDIEVFFFFLLLFSILPTSLEQPFFAITFCYLICNYY